MSKLEVKLDTKGIQALLQSDEMQEIINDVGRSILKRVGKGYGLKSKIGKKRAICTVYTDTVEAAKDNYDNNTLLKAVR